MAAQKIPATVITGFLGAGKTTLIRNLLQNAGGRKIALIINEFGDLGVDGDILKGCGIETCSEDDVVELNNGCICCTVADDFIPAMTKLLERGSLPDHIVIETSGLALPQPLVAAFNWPEVKTKVTVDGVVTVIDAAAVASGRFADDEEKVAAQRAADDSLDHDNPLEELFEDQIRAADLIVLNKADLIDRDRLEEVRKLTSAATARAVKTVAAENGSLPAEVLLGIAAGAEDLIAERKSHHEIEHEGGEEHDHDEFESFVANAGPVLDQTAFVDGLKDLIGEHDILRLKGFADIPGKPMRLVVQAVGQRIETYFDRPWGKDEKRATRLVVIGLHDGLIDAVCTAIDGRIRSLAAGEAPAVPHTAAE
ncbi:cobalamin biosynthesis protein CobW [Jiella endophytica]|uniref:Cobalamin biosynthesis protein CobW n=1 Tax=Jiella endophytica TaxID=2558362 RepID=A0A4Y8RQL3_9HYPH|nr:cobalamin biosynthesis protein CobW [Jiella endophytica]TFF25636.1 cobalamin biosynthesis protein CobW [Jiella endophytica]